MVMKGGRIGRDMEGYWHDLNGVTIVTIARRYSL